MNTPITQLPLLALLHPRGQQRLLAGALGLGALLGWLAVTRLSMPLWSAAVLTLALLLYPAARKWRRDSELVGAPTTLLSVLLITQSLHTAEHITQWVQHHMLGWPPKAASGIISPLNAEIVHFGWNWGVLLAVAVLLGAGFRGRWMWALGLWAAAHTAEHTYLFVNYLAEVQRLAAAGLPLDAAQGLPGVFGRGGWLAASASGDGLLAFVCGLAPALTSAPRLDVHFWWNAGEILLLVAAAHTSMRRAPSQPAPMRG